MFESMLYGAMVPVHLLLLTFMTYSSTRGNPLGESYTCLDPLTGQTLTSKKLTLQKLEIKVPGAKPLQADQYVCTSINLPEETNYIVQFEANAKAGIAHHIILFGCRKPLHVGSIWPCDSICDNNDNNDVPQILFAWAKNADPTRLPCDVGFRIGKETKVTSFVMQVHYAKAFADADPPDHSGLSLYVTHEKQKYTAGIFLLDTDRGQIPKNTPLYNIDASCKISTPGSIYPFAYRTHAHSLASVISGYKFNGTWTLIGKGNPQWPQAFYPVKKLMEIKRNDVVVIRCTYNSTGRQRATSIGPTHNDEMCNFYMMYYSDSSYRMSSYMECVNNQVPRVANRIPASSVEKLPPNPFLEQKGSPSMNHHAHPHKIAANLQSNRQNKFLADGNDPQPSFPGRLYSDERNYNHPYYPVLGKSYDDKLSLQDSYGYKTTDQYKRFDHQFGSHENRAHGYSRHQSLGFQHHLPKNRNRNKAFQALTKQLSGPQRNDFGQNHLWQNMNQFQRLRFLKKEDSQFATSTSLATATTPQQATVLPATSAGGHLKKTTAPKAMRGYSVNDSHTIDMTYIPDWPAKNGLKLGHVSGISVGPDGSVHVFHRGPQLWNHLSFNRSNIFQDQDKPILVPTIVVFSKEGKFIRQWGNNMFYMPHGITVDRNGSVWLTDVALHQVFRFPAGETKPDLELGERFRPGNNDQHFCEPADVAVMADGQFFVADGYCNSRLLKFSKEGTLLAKWGQSHYSTGADGFPAPNVFFIVHSVTVAEDKGLVCASDRGNGRIQCFDLAGKFQKQIHLKEFGYKLYAVDYCPQHGGILFAVNGPQNQTEKPCRVFAIDINSGLLINSWGCPKGLGFPHDISVDSVNHAIYVGDLLASTAWKLQMKSVNLSGTLAKKNLIAHPMVTPNASPDSLAKNVDEDDSNSDFKASVIVGSLLVAPMFLIVVITIFVRYYHAGKLKCCDHRGTSMTGRQQKSFFGNLLTDRHKGFNPLNTEDSDHEIDPLTNSDDEEDYRISRKT